MEILLPSEFTCLLAWVESALGVSLIDICVRWLLRRVRVGLLEGPCALLYYTLSWWSPIIFTSPPSCQIHWLVALSMSGVYCQATT